MNLTNLIIGSLAVWRLSHALVKENGPLMIFVRLRARLAAHQKRSGGLFDAISCIYCISFWIGLITALCVSQSLFELIIYALSFSAISTLIEFYINSKS